MVKDKISDYSQSALQNDNLGESGAPSKVYIDRGLKTVMSHLADINKGSESLDDTFTLADADNRSKRLRFDLDELLPSTKTILKIPPQSGTILTQEALTPNLNNWVINGNFDIWQRGTHFIRTGFTADRWHLTITEGTSAMSPIPTHYNTLTNANGAAYYARIGVIPAETGDLDVELSQTLENWHLLGEKEMTLTFYARSFGAKTPTPSGLANGLSVRVSRFNRDGDNLVQPVIEDIELDVNWSKYSFSFTVPSHDGLTSEYPFIGKSDDLLKITFYVGATSLKMKQTTVDISDVTLVNGNAKNIPVIWPTRSIAQELILCQRYYEKSFSLDQAPIYSAGSRGAATSIINGSDKTTIIPVAFSTPKRAIPTMKTYNVNARSTKMRNITRNINLRTTKTDYASEKGASIVGITTNSSQNIHGDICQVHWDADAEIYTLL